MGAVGEVVQQEVVSDEALMAAYVKGDQAAFRELFKRFSGPLTGMARRQLGSPELAKDVVQQTFLHVHRARNDFRLDARLKPWVFTIAANLIREHFRKQGRRKESLFEGGQMPAHQEPSVDPVDLAALQEKQISAERLQQALKQLPEGQSMVIELHWFQSLSFPEVAKSLGLSLSAAKVRAHRGYQRMRKILEQMEAES